MTTESILLAAGGETPPVVDDPTATPEPEKKEETPPVEEGGGKEPEKKAEGETEPEKKEEESDDEEEEERDTHSPGYALIKQIQDNPKFKDALKEIPDLRNAISRGYAYTRIFGDIESARAALEDAESFRDFETQLNEGDPGGLLASLQSSNKTAYKELCKNLMPTLLANDKETFADVVRPLTVNLIADVARAAEEIGGKEGTNLKNSALYFAKYFFGEFKIPTPVPLARAEDPERKKLKEERDGFQQEKFESIRDDVAVELDRALIGMIEADLARYDVQPYTKRALVRDIVNEVTSRLESDKEHMRVMNRLWSDAKLRNFDRSVKPRVRSAYLGRVKSMIPASIRRHVREAGLQEKGAKPAGSEEKKTFPSAGGVAASVGGGQLDPKKVDWNKTGTADIFAGKATLK